MDLKISLAGGGGGGSLVRLASLGGCSISEGVGSVFSKNKATLFYSYLIIHQSLSWYYLPFLVSRHGLACQQEM